MTKVCRFGVEKEGTDKTDSGKKWKVLGSDKPLKISLYLSECCLLLVEIFLGREGDRIEGVFRHVCKRDRVLGREQRDPGRKVP